jgi:hypothetical protein
MSASLTFVHDSGGQHFDADGMVIALTPGAFEACRRSGLNPSVVDDHTRRPEICRSPSAYQRWQLDWLARLDTATQLDGVARSCAELIVPPLDSLVIAASKLAGVVDALTPDGVTYVGSDGPAEETGYHNGHLGFWPRLGDVPLAARLLPLIAASRDLPFDVRRIEPDTPVGHTDAPLLSRARRRLARSLGPLRRVSWGGMRTSVHRPVTLMLWYASYGADHFAADVHLAGRDTVFITRGDTSFRIIDPTLPPRHRPGHPIDLTVPPVSNLAPPLMTMLDEVDQWAGVPGAGRILESRLATYVHGMCVVVACAAKQIAPEFIRFGVDAVAATNPSSLEEFACLVGAGAAGIPRTLVQHGDHLLPYSSWLVTQTPDFEHFAASDPTVAADIAADAATLGVAAPQVTNYAPRIQALRSSASRRTRRPESGTGTICYVPCFFVGDAKRVAGGHFDDAWYHRWHLRILDLMVSRPDLRFIWKGLPSVDVSPDPIPRILEERQLSNVTYESRAFLEVIGEVERVFTDYPSTALYETVHVGRPVLALAFERFATLRDEAAKRFEKVLRICDGEEDALGYLREFLDASPSEWVLPIDRISLI